MRKSLLPIIILIACSAIFAGCGKNTGASIFNPYLTATINSTSNFTAATVAPSTVDTQVNDTSTALVITGNSSDQFAFTDKIILFITDYKAAGNVFSIVEGHAEAIYVHEGVADPAASGVVAVTQITSNSIIGYFSFTTVGGTSVTNGTFSVGKP
jgi:hypothetical protein